MKFRPRRDLSPPDPSLTPERQARLWAIENHEQNLGGAVLSETRITEGFPVISPELLDLRRELGGTASPPTPDGLPSRMTDEKRRRTSQGFFIGGKERG